MSSLVSFRKQSINVTQVPVKPTITEVDAVMREISAHLGGVWMASRQSGAWFITRDDVPVSGDQLRGQRRRASFDAALGDATGLAVVRMVPLKG